MSWKHPKIGIVSAMPPGTIEKKTWRHFYSPVEDWGALCSADIPKLYSKARAWGCPEWRETHRYPKFSEKVGEILVEHHGSGYEQAYGRELLHPETRCERSLETGRWVLYSQNGVYLVVGVEEDTPVITAYRPHRKGMTVPPSSDHFRARAERRWSIETGMSSLNLRAQLQRPLESDDDIWDLALAVAAGRTATDEATRVLVQSASQRLAEIPMARRRALVPSTEEVLDDVEAVVRGDETDTAGVLLEVEDILSALWVLRGDKEAAQLLSCLQDLLEWAPVEWSRLTPLIASRLVATSGPAQEFWRNVDECVSAAVAADCPAVHTPRASLAAALVRKRAQDFSWLSQAARRMVEQALQRMPAGSGAPGSHQQPLSDGLRLHAPSPAMGTLARPETWTVRTIGRGALRDIRVFVVDEEYPDGYEVTDYFTDGETDIWQLERPGQRAVVVVVSGPDIEGEDLSTLLDEADKRGLVFEVRAFTRPK